MKIDLEIPESKNDWNAPPQPGYKYAWSCQSPCVITKCSLQRHAFCGADTTALRTNHLPPGWQLQKDYNHTDCAVGTIFLEIGWPPSRASRSSGNLVCPKPLTFHRGKRNLWCSNGSRDKLAIGANRAVAQGALALRGPSGKLEYRTV